MFHFLVGLFMFMFLVLAVILLITAIIFFVKVLCEQIKELR